MMSVGTSPRRQRGCLLPSAPAHYSACRIPGYGDVRALSTAERVVSIITQCIGVSVFGFIVANISSMLATLNVRGSLLSEKMSEVSTPRLRGKKGHGLIVPEILLVALL